MNTINAYVTKIIDDKPKFKYGKFWLTVEFDSYGTIGQCDLMFSTREEAKKIKIGYEFDI